MDVSYYRISGTWKEYSTMCVRQHCLLALPMLVVALGIDTCRRYSVRRERKDWTKRAKSPYAGKEMPVTSSRLIEPP